MQPIIEIHKATVYRGQRCVFNNLSLVIPYQSNTAILGPNGAGKSTLLKLLARELYPVQQDGSFIRIFGQERWNVWDLRTHFGIVSHDLQQQYLTHTRGINVILSGYYSSNDIAEHHRFSADDKERVASVMQQLGISELQERRFGEMSTGEQRRFLLGRALINNPATLVLDEPTSGLDLKACFQYLDIIRKLIRDGKTIILVTHHIHEIPPEIRRVILLKDGKIIADGEKSVIFANHQLSALFDTPVELVHANGFYQPIPGRP